MRRCTAEAKNDRRRASGPGKSVARRLVRAARRPRPRATARDLVQGHRGVRCVVADRAVERGFDRLVPEVWRRFFYMPFHHSENLDDQRRSVTLFDALPDKRDRRGSLRRYGRPYPEVIERFGRFPHRNEILGRESTPEEV